SGADGTLVGTAVTGASGLWTFMKAGATPTTFKLTATDAAGNTSVAPQAPAPAGVAGLDSGNPGNAFAFSVATQTQDPLELHLGPFAPLVAAIENNLANIADHAAPGVDMLLHAEASVLSGLLSHLNNTHLV